MTEREILIVDSDPAIKEYIGSIGKIYNYPIVLKESIEEGITHAEQANCIFSVIDIVIKGKHGFTFVEHVTKAGIPIPVAIMNEKMDEKYKKKMSLFFWGVKKKPISNDEFQLFLFNTLKKVEFKEMVNNLEIIINRDFPNTNMIDFEKYCDEKIKAMNTPQINHAFEEIRNALAGIKEKRGDVFSKMGDVVEEESALIKSLGESGQEEKSTVSGGDEDEQSTTASGGGEEDEQSTTVSGGGEEDEQSTTVSGGGDENEQSTTASGGGEEDEQSTTVSGSQLEDEGPLHNLESLIDELSPQIISAIKKKIEEKISHISCLEDRGEIITEIKGLEDYFKQCAAEIIKGENYSDDAIQRLSSAAVKESLQRVKGKIEGHDPNEILKIKSLPPKNEKIPVESSNDDLPPADLSQESKNKTPKYVKKTELEKLKRDILDRKNKLGQTCIMLAALELDIEEVKKQLDKFCNLTFRSKDGRSIAHYVAAGGSLDIFKLFEEKKFSLKEVDEEGNPPLVIAIRTANIEICQYLLDKVDRVNFVDNKGITPVMYAAGTGNLEILDLIINKGFNIHAKDQKGRSALWYAKKRKYKDCMALLIKKGLAA
ncbi:MAG: hypothetical protein HOE90_04265 [Bacteriovoracaceae bacterium]|jgi:ankyrin repeat protein|nr:hypothetical protein [Bacteriovoracaceae bacterium]